ncbi:MAG TPA: uracil-DNA glycosylase family protein [Actinomycetota bacterium]|nr:uracil-DNA glycosylase family protein [Actinomycetota bacterium]
MPTELEAVAAEAAGCTRCRLHEGRTQVVFGQGDPNADLMFVGEAPGFHEDRQGVPFVGPSGQLLNRLLGGIGLRRQDVYVTNVVRCLRYNARVQLGDGSWERIGRLVRSRYDGTVMSVDAEGRLVRRLVTGWHASPLAGRRVFRLTYRSAKHAGAGQVSIQLTGDHEVMTDRGFIAVEQLPAGARIATGQGMSRIAREIVYGTLLGDGHLTAAEATLSFGHSTRQEAYARYKAELLAELSPRVKQLNVSAVAGGPAAYPVVHVRTLAHRALGLLRSEFYRPRKRVPPWMAERLTPLMLAIWFMDDGHLRIRPGRRPLAEIATYGFSEEDHRVLVSALARLGLEARVTGKRQKLVFGVAATAILSELIAPYVPPSMRYKVDPEVEPRVPFDPTRTVPGDAEVLFDEADVRDITDRYRSDVTFFCIDVEETHNFVTTGGVVHNCRPPRNRDPLPDEIAACRPWLDAQIRLVDPKVVVTLGNFAARTLLETTTGISRLRGRTYPFQGRVLLPTFHPAAALHAQGRGTGGPGPLEAMEGDFRVLAELLAAPAPGDEDRPSEQLGLF